MCKIEKKELVKETIKGKPKVSTATITYYQSPDPTSETTIDDVDYSVVFTESFQSKVGSNVAINCDNEQILEQPAATTQQLTSTPTQQKQPVDGVASSQKTSTSDRNNNNSHGKLGTQQLPAAGNKIHNSPQKQQPSGTSPGGWTIGLALLFGAAGATLVAMGVIPEITAIGIIATAVLLGIASAALGGTVGYLTDIAVNKCHSEAATKVA